MVAQKMVDFGDDIGKSLEENKDENWVNECNVDIYLVGCQLSHYLEWGKIDQ